MRRVNMGRKKIQMKMIPAKNARQVAFSKRRASLFKKANELCTLTGSELAIIVFSPGGKAFSFGHPSVGTITRRFLNQRPMPDSDNQDPHGSTLSSLNQQYYELRERLAAEKKRGEELKQMMMETQKHCWFASPLDELNLNQLMMAKVLMENLRKKVVERFEELSVEASIPAPSSSANSVGGIDLNVANPAEMEDSVYP